MTRRLLEDEDGAVTADWLTLSAGIVLLGIMVIFSVMNNSAGYLMDEFDDLNNRFAEDSAALALNTPSGTDLDADDAAAANASAALSTASASGIAAATSAASRTAASTAAIDHQSSSAVPAAQAEPGTRVPVPPPVGE